jgi:ATP-binding cassette, subfamily B, bacterial
MLPTRDKPKPSFRPSRAAIRSYFTYTAKGLALAWRASPKLGVAIVFLTAISAALPPAMAYVGKLIIDAVVAGHTSRTAEFVLLEFALIGAITLVQRTLFLARTLLGNRLGINVNSSILAKAIELDLSQIENSEFYDKLNRARQEASSRSLSMVTDSFQFIQNALTLFGYVALLLAFSGWAVLALVLASLPATYAEMRFSSIGFKLYNWRSADRRRLAYMEYVLANDSHAKEVRIFGLGERFLARYKALAERFYGEDSALARRRTFWVIALSLLSSGAFYGCYLVIALRAARGEITLGNLTLYVVVFRQGQQAFQSCLAAIGGTYEHNLYLSNLFDFLAIPRAARPEALRSGAETEGPPAGRREGIFFDRVSFRYPGRDTYALRNISLYIPKAQSVAVVGSNGAGKSTLIKLLCRLYYPTEGRIFLDGKDLRDWDHAALLKRISVVFQDFNRYQLSLKENVGVGEIGAAEDEAHVKRAIERGGAGELLAEMPQGLETSLGTWFRDGRELSGGQWQKIAVSRAFMREEADILILDEPTAALDAEAESRAFQAFHELTVGKTSLIISHRFPVARLADHIVVIEQGEIQEEGGHEELTAKGGRYAQLFALQASGYV